MWCELCVVSAPEIPEYPNSNFWATREMTAHGYDTDDENTHLRPHQKVSLLSRPPLSARKRRRNHEEQLPAGEGPEPDRRRIRQLTRTASIVGQTAAPPGIHTSRRRTASGIRSGKDGAPKPFATSWRGWNSRQGRSSHQSWGVTVPCPTPNDGVGVDGK